MTPRRPLRWLYHLARGDAPQRGPEGFVHCSYASAVFESARLYFPAGERLRLLRIDPRRVRGLREEATPRGPMPHVYGAIDDDAIAERGPLEEGEALLDEVRGLKVAFVGFAGMTLLDLVGVLDPVARIASAGIDAGAICDVVSAKGRVTWEGGGASFVVERERPPLDGYDLVVVAGGLPTRALVDDEGITRWLASFPSARRMASVCTGALLLGAAGRLRGRRATTHATALDLLARYGATAVSERVVDDEDVVTAAGVTSGIHLGLHLVGWLYGDDARARIAKQIEV